MGVLLIVGTEKGAFLVRSDEARARWAVEGPVFKGWKITSVKPPFSKALGAFQPNATRYFAPHE